MSVYLLVLRVELPDHVQEVPQIAYQAPNFEVKGDRISYAEAAANVVNPITFDEVTRHRGCRQFSTITIETYITEEAIIPDEESKQKEKMPVVDGKKRNPDALTHTAKSVADAVAEATNTKKRHESPKRSKKFGKDERKSPGSEVEESAAIQVGEAAGEETEASRPGSGRQRIKSTSPTLQMPSTIRFFSGNPSVETTEGIIHLYKDSQQTSLTEEVSRSEMICMLTVPASMTSRDLLEFVSACETWIESMKIIKDNTPNKYMVLIKFKKQEHADDFYNSYNNQPFNMIEPETCHLVYVAKVESVKEGEGAGLPVTGLTELPVCPVCLERMDESLNGILTVLCNHSFHTSCLAQWGDTSCPVCRYVQTPEPTEDQKCMQCESQDSLWICLVCGHVGCGRYVGGHAFTHFQETQHTYSMQLGNNRVWDYAGDNYVHRLIQNKGDGKLVEVDEGGNVMQTEKVDSIQLEYTYLLTSQLESQRHYFEERMASIEQDALKRVEETEKRSKLALEKCEKLERRLEMVTKEKLDSERRCKQLHDRLSKVLGDLSEEQEMNKSLRKNQADWQSKVTDLEKQIEAKNKVIADLEDQVRDVMFTLEAQHKLADATGLEASREEIEGGQIIVGPAATGSSSSRKGRKKGR